MELHGDPLGESALGQASQAAVDFGIDLRELDFLLALTPLERLQRHDQALQLIMAAREAGIRHYGFDPRPAEDPGQA